MAACTSCRWRPLTLGGAYLMATLSYAAPKLQPVALFVTGDSLLDKRGAEGLDRVLCPSATSDERRRKGQQPASADPARPSLGSLISD